MDFLLSNQMSESSIDSVDNLRVLYERLISFLIQCLHSSYIIDLNPVVVYTRVGTLIVAAINLLLIRK